MKNGAKVYISSRTAKDCEETAKELNALGPGKCVPIVADMQKLSDVDKLVGEISSKEKALHVLVNNAGAAWGDKFDIYPDHAWTKVLTLNLHRVFTLTQKCLPLLRAGAKEGGKRGATYLDPARIINIGSVEGLEVPSHETYAYSASKAGLHHLSRTMGGRLGWEGITSNTIACGPFPSKMTAWSLRNEWSDMAEKVPLTRVGTPEDVAGTALFLASRAGAYVNAATITLDGGMTSAYPRSRL